MVDVEALEGLPDVEEEHPEDERGDQHVEENAGASDIRLSQAEIAQIDAAFPRGRPRSLPML